MIEKYERYDNTEEFEFDLMDAKMQTIADILEDYGEINLVTDNFTSEMIFRTFGFNEYLRCKSINLQSDSEGYLVTIIEDEAFIIEPIMRSGEYSIIECDELIIDKDADIEWLFNDDEFFESLNVGEIYGMSIEEDCNVDTKSEDCNDCSRECGNCECDCSGEQDISDFKNEENFDDEEISDKIEEFLDVLNLGYILGQISNEHELELLKEELTKLTDKMIDEEDILINNNVTVRVNEAKNELLELQEKLERTYNRLDTIM